MSPSPSEPADADPDATGPADAEAIAVEVCNLQSHLAIEPRKLAGLAERVLRREGVRRASISLAIVDDPAIQRLNRAHLGHDRPTDVISFPLSEPGAPALAGELVVSAETARATAERIGADPDAELALYLVHGLLHLCGFDDMHEDEARRMRAKEDEALRAEGIVNPFPLAEGARAFGRGRGRATWSA